jgi:tetratricopeptide (TPR) repeat protein
MRDEHEGGREPRETRYAAVFASLEVRTPGLLKALQRKRAEATALLEELMKLPPAERARAVMREERFRQAHLAERLLEETQTAEAQEAEELARLAFTVATQARQPKEQVRNLQVRACCFTGTALRLQGRLREADESFAHAAHYLEEGATDPERAEYCRDLARLRASQGRLDESLALFWRAGYLFGEAAELHEQGVCLASIGLLYLGENAHAEALASLSRARIHLCPELSPRLACRSRLALALCLAHLDQPVPAWSLVQEARRLYAELPDVSARVRFHWMEGKVAARVGREAEALDLFRFVRERLIAEGEAVEAGLATVDLGVLLVRRGEGEEIGGLIRELRHIQSPRPDALGVPLALSAFEIVTQKGLDEVEKAAEQAARLLLGRRYGRTNLDE